MKKKICLVLIIISVIGCLTACNFTLNNAKDEAESTPFVEEMLAALTSDNISEAEALLHPAANDSAREALNQMIAYLNGKKISSTELINVNFTSSVGTAGKVHQEQVNYRLKLDNVETVYINAVYLSNDDGTGFVSFQLVLGLV